MKKTLLLSIIICTSLHLKSQSIITDRPDQTESSSVIERGSLQIEAGALITETGEFGDKSVYLPTSLFRIGLTDKIELRLLSQIEHKIYNQYTVNGFNDLEIGIKFQILQNENKKTEIAYLSHFLIPTSSDFFSNNTYGSINKLCVSHNIHEKIGLGYNFGCNYYENNTLDLTYSLVMSFGINDKTNIYIEPYGAIIDCETSESNINMGATYLLKENIQLDYSVGTGLNHTFNFISLGCSYKLAQQ